MENNEINYKEYYYDSEKAKNMNIRLGIIKSIYELKYKDEQKNKLIQGFVLIFVLIFKNQ